MPFQKFKEELIWNIFETLQTSNSQNESALENLGGSLFVFPHISFHNEVCLGWHHALNLFWFVSWSCLNPCSKPKAKVTTTEHLKVSNDYKVETFIRGKNTYYTCVVHGKIQVTC